MKMRAMMMGLENVSVITGIGGFPWRQWPNRIVPVPLVILPSFSCTCYIFVSAATIKIVIFYEIERTAQKLELKAFNFVRGRVQLRNIGFVYGSSFLNSN